MQISQDLLLETGGEVQLTGGAKTENIFRQVSGQTTLLTHSTLKGIVLNKAQIVMETGASSTVAYLPRPWSHSMR
mgnify:FL=1|tara:strand:+ start:1484 stop:1708 length:225 start_codon:yes stop_codon:yes gene_type:complete